MSILLQQGALSDCPSAGAVVAMGVGTTVGQRITMKKGTEGRFVSRVQRGDGLLYCRGDRCGWHVVAGKARVKSAWS